MAIKAHQLEKELKEREEKKKKMNKLGEKILIVKIKLIYVCGM